MIRRRYSAEAILEEWANADEKEKHGLDYETWKSIVATSFSRKSGYSRPVAQAFLESKNLRAIYDDKLPGNKRRNPETVAKVIWCKFKGTKKSAIC